MFRNLILLALVFTVGVPAHAKKSPKNIILIIGDGMGMEQISLGMFYAQHKKQPMHLKDVMNAGTLAYVTTNAKDTISTDSACSATQMATGEPSRAELIGVDWKGDRAETILEFAKKKGLSTGLVSDTRITHATPAAFATHQPNRRWETQIAENLLETQPDVMLSAGLAYFIPQSGDKEWLQKKVPKHLSLKSMRTDNKNLLREAETKGYDLAFTKSQLEGSKNSKVLGLFFEKAYPDGIQRSHDLKDKNRNYPDLTEMSLTAIDKLSKNDKGFFLMIEGGQIDWAAHRNDAAWLLHEVLHFDKMVGAVRDWASKNGDTLVLITADHETGGFGFSYNFHDIPKPQKLYGNIFKNGPLYQARANLVSFNVLDKLYSQKKSFLTVLTEFNALPKSAQKPKRLKQMINEVSEYDITTKEAKSVLASHKIKFSYEGGITKEMKVAKFNDFPHFYKGDFKDRTGLVARALARQTGVTWSTGGHTSSPVPLVSWGPGAEKFKGVYPNYLLGRKMKEALD